MENACHLLKEIYGGLQVQFDIRWRPFDAFLLIFLLYLHEIAVIVELLELLVGEVDAELLETIVLGM